MKRTAEELRNDFRYSVAGAIAGLAILGGAAYGTYSIVKGEHSWAEALAPPLGGVTIGGSFVGYSIKNMMSIVRERRQLQNTDS